MSERNDRGRDTDSTAVAVDHETLFEGMDIALDVYDGGHPLSIITFDSRSKYISATEPGPFGSGYGRGRFAPLGFNEYLIKRNRNHWYQTSEMDTVAGIVNARARGTRVITYGSSMGGFAAINFAEMLNADDFIALSPMHDISVGNEAGDRRWSENAVLSFTHNLISSGQSRHAHGYVFYAQGSDGQDVTHAELIRRDTQAVVTGVEYGGHPCSFFLNETYGLKRLVTEIGTGTFDLEAFHRVVQENVDETFYPYERRAAQLVGEAKDLPAAIEQIRIAISKKGDLARLHNRLGELLRRADDLTGAEEAYWRSLTLKPRGADANIGLSYVHAARNDYEAAVRAVDAAIVIKPKPEYYARRGEWLILQGDLVQAEQAMLKVIELVPDAVTAPKRLQAIRTRMADRNGKDAGAARKGLSRLLPGNLRSRRRI